MSVQLKPVMIRSRSLLKITLFFFIVYYLPRFCHEKTEGFSLARIHSNLSYKKEWEVPCEEIPDIFHQKFTFLATGGQVYAFVSEDGKTVLKFFKHHLRRLPLWLRFLPLPHKYAQKREATRTKREKKLLRDFQSYKLAYQLLREESGLLYVHLNKSNTLKKKAHIVDKLGIEHTINLDEVEFVLQKKAELTFPYLTKLIEEKHLAKAKKSLDSLCRLLLTLCQKGVYDEDPRIRYNIGFIEEKAMLIDVGRLKIDRQRQDPNVQKTDLIKITAKLSMYLKDNCPELAEYLENFLCTL